MLTHGVGHGRMSELSSIDRALLDALWALRGEALVSARRVRERVAASGTDVSVAQCRRGLNRLVDRGYADRLTYRRGERGPKRIRYWPTRRDGETLPANLRWLEASDLAVGARTDWRLWSVTIGERMVWVDNWGMRASEQEWAWLASRPLLALDGQLTRANHIWWDDEAADNLQGGA